MQRLIVGIDPGTTTGYAIWDRELKRLALVTSMKIHAAMDHVRAEHHAGALVRVVFEDARKRTWFRKADAEAAKYGAAVREGAGAAKRDSAIWEDFLTDLGVPFEARKPAPGTTKWRAEYFERVTGWTGRTNEHGRDAALLVLQAR